MRADLLSAKAESLQRCVARVRQTCPATAAELASNVDAQDIVSVNLIRAIQLAVDMATHASASIGLQPPASMGESFDRLADAGVIAPELAQRLRGAVGFRNVAVHAYSRIDWAVVHALATDRLADLLDFSQKLLARSQR